MIYTIPKGKHRCKPLRLGFWFGRDTFRWKVKFAPSCKYDLKSVDQFDINKLVGVGFLPTHHKDSARFGWKYNTKTDLIELFAYCYIDGKRQSKYICDIVSGSDISVSLQIMPSAYIFQAGLTMVTIKHHHQKRFCYRLGAYFGGNETAPHEMKINITPI
jgi:hypothetical protein